MSAQTTLLSRADVVCPDTAKADGPDAPPVALPFHSATLGCRARVRFDVPGAPADDWAVYLPYLYGGGNVQLNGMPVAAIGESGAGRVVRWERPFLVRLPREQLHAGSNELVLRVAVEPVARRAIVPRFEVGPQAALADAYEARLFWVRTMSQITTVCAWVIGVLVLVIWWYRHDEMLYGLFGVASLLWGVRSLNLVIESVPEPWWAVWRLTYLASTGGFAIALSVFQWRLAGIRVPRVERALIGYGLACPILFVLAPGNDALVGQAWTAGLLPVIAAATLALGLEAWRRPTGERVALCAAVCVALVAGAHDFLVHASSPLLSILAPRAAADRLFLLQYSADLLLLVMGGCLCARFVRTLDQLTTLSRTLEQRVAARELALTEKFQIIGALEKRHATDEERQRILRDLHDGLGSQLFVTLSRVETGAIARGEVADALRMCLADMRAGARLEVDSGELGTVVRLEIEGEPLP